MMPEAMTAMPTRQYLVKPDSIEIMFQLVEKNLQIVRQRRGVSDAIRRPEEGCDNH